MKLFINAETNPEIVQIGVDDAFTASLSSSKDGKSGTFHVYSVSQHCHTSIGSPKKKEVFQFTIRYEDELESIEEFTTHLDRVFNFTKEMCIKLNEIKEFIISDPDNKDEVIIISIYNYYSSSNFHIDYKITAKKVIDSKGKEDENIY